MEFTEIVEGLNVDVAKILAPFKGKYSSKLVKATAFTLASNLGDPDEQTAAARMLIYDSSRPCGNLAAYTKLLSHQLRPEICSFLQTHQQPLDSLLTTHRKYDYLRHSYFSASVDIKTYQMKPCYGETSMETPGQRAMRLAVEYYHNWPGYDGKTNLERIEQCFLQLVQWRVCPPSPAWFNLGTNNPQAGSCFLIRIDDQLASILYTGVGDSGMIAQANGGLGLGMSDIRHSMIKDVGMSSGVMPVARIYDRSIQYVDQGGKRDGAGTAFLDIHHYDALDFIKATDNFTDHSLRFNRLNTAMWMYGLFFERLAEGGKWTVFCPAKTPILNSLSGWEYEQRYLIDERLAEEREADFRRIEAKTMELRNLLMDDPTDEKARLAYNQALEEKRVARKARIEHVTYTAREIMEAIADTQTRSGMPYIMHNDAINSKCNQKNLVDEEGRNIKIKQSNLCLEITEAVTTKNIASCNLHSINWAAPVRDCLRMDSKVTDPDFPIALRAAYNFKALGEATRACVDNVNRTIDLNAYPLDSRNEKGELVRGKISRLNFETRPLGIGGSGFSDAAYLMDLPFDDPRTEEWNRVLFACQYFHGIFQSIQWACWCGPYAAFRTGSYQQYIGCITEETAAGPRKVPQYRTNQGSPAANGQFQFDLWAEETRYLQDFGKLDTRLRKPEDDLPVDPSRWGQEPMVLRWQSNRRAVLEEGAIPIWEEHVVKPTWESLRLAMMSFGLYNSLIFALMPTASTAQLIDNCETTEAPQGMLYSRQINSGNYTVVNRHLSRDLRELGCLDDRLVQFLSACKGSVKWLVEFIEEHPEWYSSLFAQEDGICTLRPLLRTRLQYLVKKYPTMFEVSQRVPLLYAAHRGRYTCQSQSQNIYLSDPTVKQLTAIHTTTYRLGLKTGMYYLRQDPAQFCGDFNLDPEILEYHRELTKRKGGREEGARIPPPPINTRMDTVAQTSPSTSPREPTCVATREENGQMVHLCCE